MSERLALETLNSFVVCFARLPQPDDERKVPENQTPKQKKQKSNYERVWLPSAYTGACVSD